jgi:hypothetical protein
MIWMPHFPQHVAVPVGFQNHAALEGKAAVHKPFRRKVGRRAHGQNATVLPAQQFLGAIRNAIECIADDGQIAASGLGDDEALALPIEQLQPQLCLERFHLVADRALRDAKLIRRAGEAFVAGSGFEGLECIERRQSARHGEPTS